MIGKEARERRNSTGNWEKEMVEISGRKRLTGSGKQARRRRVLQAVEQKMTKNWRTRKNREANQANYHKVVEFGKHQC